MGKVQEVFGKFAVKVGDEVKMFDDSFEAEKALVMAVHQEEMEARAKAYIDARGLEGKNAVGKTRIVMDFMAFEHSSHSEDEDF
jgi:hypothetical protein